MAVVVTGNALAYRFAWYWRFGWLDLAMHLVGGLAVGLLIISLTTLGQSGSWQVWLGAIVAALLAGILWELAQYYGYVFGWQAFNALQLGWSDTLGDLTSDALGGFLAWLTWYRFNYYGAKN